MQLDNRYTGCIIPHQVSVIQLAQLSVLSKRSTKNLKLAEFHFKCHPVNN
jgi:hypothetical protein